MFTKSSILDRGLRYEKSQFGGIISIICRIIILLVIIINFGILSVFDVIIPTKIVEEQIDFAQIDKISLKYMNLTPYVILINSTTNTPINH